MSLRYRFCLDMFGSQEVEPQANFPLLGTHPRTFRVGHTHVAGPGS
jgi:hypothetical protein